MNSYNINDLVIATYKYVNIEKNGRGKILKTLNHRKSVLCKLENGNYFDIVTCLSVKSSDVMGAKPFVARNELLTREQIIYIFNALEEFKLDESFEESVEILSSDDHHDDFNPVDAAFGFLNEAATKVKSIGKMLKK